MRAGGMIALAAAVLLPPAAVAGDLTFTGNLRFVASSSMTLRLQDGRVIDARLPLTGTLSADALVNQFSLADEVQISCRKIQNEFDQQVERDHSLILTQIRFLRAPTSEEVGEVNRSLFWHRGENLLHAARVQPGGTAMPHAPEPEGFARIREVNLARLQELPNFVADETAVRWRRVSGSTQWAMIDKVESEIVYQGDSATRQNVRINGRIWNGDAAWIPGVNWGFGFGNVLGQLFGRDCDNEFTPEIPSDLADDRFLHFNFRAPRDGCFGADTVGFQQYAPAQAGRIVVDAARGNVLQVERHSDGSPSVNGGSDSVVLTWAGVKIGDTSHLLPAQESYIFSFLSGTMKGDTWKIEVRFANYRHFEAATAVHFADDGRE